ncbi:MAG: isochorismatase family protein, partial [Pseudomonadota bacterium]
AYTDIDTFATAYETDPNQIGYINELASLARSKHMPVIWTYVAYMDNADDAGVWGTRTNTPDSLQNIKVDSERSELDPRLEIDRSQDAILNKRMASVFHETLLPSLLTWHKVDTVILTGGSTSGCVRASAVAALSLGFRTIVPEECVADKHEIPHFANLCDIMLKYADVLPVAEVRDWLTAHSGAAPIRQARGAPF